MFYELLRGKLSKEGGGGCPRATRRASSHTWITAPLIQPCRLIVVFSLPFKHVSPLLTSQGQLIETSGAMTGGGNQVLRGRMGNQVKETADPKEVEKLEKAFEQKSSECQRIRMNRARLEEANVRLNREVTAGRQSLDQFSMEVDRLSADGVAFARNMKISEGKLKNVKPDQREVERLEKRIPQLKNVSDGRSSFFMPHYLHSLHSLPFTVYNAVCNFSLRSTSVINIRKHVIIPII